MDKRLIERAIDSAKHRQYKLSADLERELSENHRSKAQKQRQVAEVTVKALERMMPKKPILCMNEVSGMFVDYADGHGEYKTQTNNWWRCPCCNSVVGQRVIVFNHIHDQRKKKFCEDCGCSIDWSE